MKPILARLLGWPLLFVVLLNAMFYLRQPHIVFYPYAELEATPAQWGLPFEEVVITSTDGVLLHGWFLPRPQASHTLLFFHGNGGNISHRGDSLAIFHRLGLNVLIIDYRGYGRSQGEPSEAGLYRDAEAAWRYLIEQRRIEAEKVILFGRSLGGAVALHLATRVQPAAVIIESTFTSARGMARQLFPLLSHLILLRYSFDSERKIRHISAPLLLAHSPQDRIIPYAMGRELYQLAPEPKRFLQLRGDHNGGFLQSQPEYETVLREFVLGL